MFNIIICVCEGIAFYQPEIFITKRIEMKAIDLWEKNGKMVLKKIKKFLFENSIQ